MSRKINGAKTPRKERLARRYREAAAVSRRLGQEMVSRIASRDPERAGPDSAIASAVKAFGDAMRLQIRLEDELLAQAPGLVQALEHRDLDARHQDMARSLDSLQKEWGLCASGKGMHDVLTALAERCADFVASDPVIMDQLCSLAMAEVRAMQMPCVAVLPDEDAGGLDDRGAVARASSGQGRKAGRAELETRL